MPTQSSPFDMLPTVLNLTQLEFGIRKVVKKTLGLDAVVFPQSADNEDKDQNRLDDALARALGKSARLIVFGEWMQDISLLW